MILEGNKTDLLASGKIERYAILTEETWIEKIAQFSDLLTPMFQIKV